MFKPLLAGLLGLHSVYGFALSECRDIPDDRKRLACYDNYSGYSGSLIDYNHYVNRLSLGILIYDWL